MSAISILKKKSLPVVDIHVNEFAALEDLDPEARPVKSKSGRNDHEVQRASTGGQREDPLSSRWIRDNVKVTQTRKGPQVMWTPWKNGSELSLIRDWFFPQHATKDPYSAPTEDLRKCAVHTVNRWEEGNKDLELPHSILATSNLTDATLHDTKPATERAQYISDQALQSIYAMAFCRFVNGFVDRDVSKSSLTALATTTIMTEEGTTAVSSSGESSMYALAAKIGLPLRFVDMRHQITHEKMPSIEELARLTEEALDWMYRRWWEVYAAFDSTEAWQQWGASELHRLRNSTVASGGKRDAEAKEDGEGAISDEQRFKKSCLVVEDVIEET
jgi:hypothetical protein